MAQQILCFDTAIDAEKFCSSKSAIFIVLPEEDTSKHFMASLIVQQFYREILAVADERGGRLSNRVMMYLDEFGTIPKVRELIDHHPIIVIEKLEKGLQCTNMTPYDSV